MPLAGGPAKGKEKGKVILQRRATVIGVEPDLGAQVQVAILVERKTGNESGRIRGAPGVKRIRDKLRAFLVTPDRRRDRKDLGGRGRSFKNSPLEHSGGRKGRGGLEDGTGKRNRRSEQRGSGARGHANSSVERSAEQGQRRSGILGGMPQSGDSGRGRWCVPRRREGRRGKREITRA